MIRPDVPATVGAGENRAHEESKEPPPSMTTWFCAPNWLPGHRNICIRGVPPETAVSTGVEKLALFVPAPSAASART
jgi:hypothetical protein